MNADRILIVDIETTGLRGEPEDHVVEVGIAALCLDRDDPATFGQVVPVYSDIVAPYYDEPADFEHSWIFEHTDLTPDQVRAGKPMEVVADNLRFILDHASATSFNYEFDFDRFLRRAPWNVANHKLPCIMQTAGHAYGDVLPCSYYSGCPNAQTTYNYLCPDNPAELPNGIEAHRALSDAIMEGHMLKAMITKGDYMAVIG